MTTTPVFGDTAQSTWQRVMLMTSLRAAQLATPAAWYEMLEEYYVNNGLYDLVSQTMYENAIWTPNMKPLRNPANRAVEFYVSKLWPGNLESALPIVTEKQALADAITQIWEWSNWKSQKQVSARWLAMFGDLGIKVTPRKDSLGNVKSVYLDPIKANVITEMEEDERGYLTFIRMDVADGEGTHTEVWSKKYGYRVWKHKREVTTPISQLGDPTISKEFSELGFDFIPIVHAKFKDIGNVRGLGCFVHVLDKIDEANRQATRLHEILFRYNKPDKAVTTNAMDASGKPLPPPSLAGRDGSSTANGDALKTGDDDIWLMPGMSKIEYLIPPIRYDAALSILNAQMDEIKHDLPEIMYNELTEKSDLSGEAIKRMMGPAIDRVVEARGNAHSALIRANQMAITIAQIHNLDGFRGLGNYEKGDLKHTFAEQDVIPLSRKERSESVKADVDAGLSLSFSMKQNGYTDQEIKDNQKAKEEERSAEGNLLGNLVLDAVRNRDQGINQ